MAGNNVDLFDIGAVLGNRVKRLDCAATVTCPLRLRKLD